MGLVHTAAFYANIISSIPNRGDEMGKIHILQVIGGNEIGGAEKHLLALCRELNKNPEQFEVSLVCLCEGPLKENAENEGIAVYSIPMRNSLDLTIIWKLTKLIKYLNIDIVHTHGSRANLVARLAAKRLGLPIVTTVHSSLAQDYKSRWAALAAVTLDKLTTPWATRVITISNYLQQEVKNRGAKRVTTIYNGIDPQALQGINLVDHLLQELGMHTEGPLIGTIGRLHPVKGQHYFLEAAALVATSHPTAKFILVGDGPLEAELRGQTRALGLEDKVIFTGYYPHVERILAVLDVFCLPSLAEGMGLVLLEAMYFGKPVVASNVGGIPEIVKSGVNGLLVPPADARLLATAISRLLDDPTLAAKLGASGQTTFEQFSLDKMVQRTGNLYKELSSEETSPVI
jgi:glycosyltransferase involved in cell wall biosynthesis